MTAALLRGRDYPEAGALGEAIGDGIAVALSRGGAAKPYPHVDPNEDDVLAVRGGRGALVAVADGHWGHRAAQTAIERLLGHAERWTESGARGPDAWYQEMVAALVDLNEAVLALHVGEERSRSTFSLALARPAENLLVHAAVGDSHLFVVDAVLATELPRPRKPIFLGQGHIRASAFERDGRVTVQALDEPRALVAVSDGISEQGIGVVDPASTIWAAVTEASTAAPAARAARAARGIVEAALAAHRTNQAGDNIAAAVAWLER